MPKLEDWMREKNVTATQIAEACQVDSTTISRLIPSDGKKQHRRPSMELAERIAIFTQGEVTPNDFMDESVLVKLPPRDDGVEPTGEVAA